MYMNNPKNLDSIISEMRQVAEITVTSLGEGKQINLANLTVIIDSWRFNLENIDAELRRDGDIY